MVDAHGHAGRRLLARAVDVTVALFGGLSFWALREFITLTPTRIADHRTLFWVFFVFTPLQFYFVATGQYEVYSILIPVYAFLFIPARIALAGDFKRYLERSTTIQTGLMICVYCLSYAPALLSLRFPCKTLQPVRLLLFFFIIVALCDAFHYVCEKLLGKHLIAPAISQNKTWEGFFGGLGCASLAGMALYWASPFHAPQAAMMAALISAMGYCGGLTMSAIKRDRGVKDYGTLLVGHAGVLDRIDSICFAAPVFYHVTKYLVTRADVDEDWARRRFRRGASNCGKRTADCGNVESRLPIPQSAVRIYKLPPQRCA